MPYGITLSHSVTCYLTEDKNTLLLQCTRIHYCYNVQEYIIVTQKSKIRFRLQQWWSKAACSSYSLSQGLDILSDGWQQLTVADLHPFLSEAILPIHCSTIIRPLSSSFSSISQSSSTQLLQDAQIFWEKTIYNRRDNRDGAKPEMTTIRLCKTWHLDLEC